MPSGALPVCKLIGARTSMVQFRIGSFLVRYCVFRVSSVDGAIVFFCFALYVEVATMTSNKIQVKFKVTEQ